jgi:hypothetical protein
MRRDLVVKQMWKKGVEHVLSLNNTRRREILRFHYGHIAGV